MDLTPVAAEPERMEEADRPSEDDAAARQAAEAALWTHWVTGKDRGARTKIILQYLPMARAIARDLMYKIGSDYLDYADLIQMATVGLINAVDRFDPRRLVPFRAFAEKRVKGAVLNGVANNSEMHAQVAYRQRHRLERVDALRPDRPVHDSVEYFSEMVEMAVGLAVGFMLEGTGLFNAAPDAPNLGYGESGEIAAQSDLFRKLLSHLPETERAVLELHYASGLQFGEVGRLLGLSKGRISQIHKAALSTLRQLARSHTGLDLRI